MSIVFGTNCFIDRASAQKYYKVSNPDLTHRELLDLVDEKIKDGTINVGERPSLKPGERLRIIASEGRYAIETAKDDPVNRANGNYEPNKERRPIEADENIGDALDEFDYNEDQTFTD